MLTILERPDGHILSTTQQTATVSESYGAGDAQFVVPTVHGLVDGDYIYAESDIENYAGFWYVDVTTTGIFKLKPYADGDYVQFIATGSITWYKSLLKHGWSCVHLPITYRISSDLYPVNESDTTRTITSVTNSNGYSVVHLSGSLGSAVNSYDFINLTVPSDTDYSGVYQILEFISPTVMIINLEYDSGINWTSASALKYYSNYNILVRVYAGINASHEWTAQKPYELAATLQMIPDESNEVFFSINEILKSYIETKNNLTLGTLPNNIDFWVGFYIEVAEQYDDSDGYVFGTYTGNFTSDQSTFEGHTVNAKLEFKNQYSGYLSEYLMTNSAAKFLTLFSIPVLFSCTDETPDCYSDISFINPYDNNNITLQKEYYNSDVLQSTVNTNLGELDSGVIRVELEADCDYDRVDVTVLGDAQLQFPNTDFEGSLDGWNSFNGSDRSGGASYGSWSFSGGNANASGNSGTKYLAAKRDDDPLLDWPAGSYVVSITAIGYTDGSTVTGSVYGMPSSAAQTLIVGQVLSAPFSTDGTTPVTRTITFTTLADFAYLAFAFDGDGLDMSMQVSEITITEFPSDQTVVSETKQFKIDCGCSKQELRLTWLNNLGGFEYWSFNAQKDHIVEIQETGVTKKNILPQWPKSYGSQADTIRKQTFRESNKSYTVRSQLLTEDEADAISYIKSSVLVQIINSRTDRRTVIVDTDSFVKFKDGDKTFEVAFNISFTDDIPVQTV